MLYRLVLAAAFLATAPGCTHTRALDPGAAGSQADINDRATAATALVTLDDGRRIRVQSLHVAPDVATGIVPETGQLVSMPTATVMSVTFRSRRRGVLEGLGIGLAVGVGGAAFGALLTRGNAVDAEWGASVGGVIVGVPSIVVGGVAGFLQGSETVYLTRGPEPH